MPLTRAFGSGNSQAIRIPADLAYELTGQDLRIVGNGDVLTISPARLSLTDAVAELRSFPKPPEIEVREGLEMPNRFSL